MAIIPFDTPEEAEARTREMWTDILGAPKKPEDVTEFLYGVRERVPTTGDEMSDPNAGLPDGVDVAIEIAEADPYLDQLLREDQMTPEEIASLVELYPAWQPDTAYKIDDLVSYANELYKTVQAHISQVGWEPPIVPALFTNVAPEGVIPEWVQPTGAHDAYALGAQVTHNGLIWESTVAANVWEPGVYGWVEVN